MANYQDGDIQTAWDEILASEYYRNMISGIAAGYPDVKSMNVKYSDIDAYDPDFALFVLNNPDRCIRLGKDRVRALMPPAWDGKEQINLRLIKLPRDANVDIRRIRSKHLGTLIAVDGLVRKVTTVRPRMVYALFTCARCGAEQWVPQKGMILNEPIMCSNPDGSCNKQSTRFILDDKSSMYIDTQKIEVQESPEGLRGGAQPERLSGFLEDDISGAVTAGNRVTMNGIIRSAEKQERDKSTVFDIYMDVMSIEFEQHEYDDIQITEEDEKKILEMSRDPELYQKITASISPTIYGMEEVKQALALQLFGGSHKEMDDGTSIRGDMHILLIGDPGVAKSQLLRYMGSLAPRGIYTSGKSASAAGLTAAAVKDDFGDGRWTLEAGALVLADKGLACIDELDKMTNQDRSSLHEAMESQKISVAKAGITATLQCRCSMLAAANPKYGRFEDTDTITNQIDLPPALMSRFDMIFVLTDKPNRNRDKDITSHILKAHRRGQVRAVKTDEKIEGVDVSKILEDTDNIKPYYDIETLRKYVAYSKRIVPVMTEDAANIIENSYLDIRKMGEGENASVPITARQLEGYVRLSEASARMRLSNVVTDADANRAVDMVEYYLGRIAAPDGGQWDIDIMATGITKKDRDSVKVIKEIITLFQSSEGISVEEIIKHAAEEGIPEDEVKKVIKQIYKAGDIYEHSFGVYKRT
ncbi:MAG: minichromosome maintenance protein MCM [Candidatus Methanomethylophilaceae archaeon]